MAGLITGLQLKRTKNGDLCAIVTVEDLDGSVECLFFPSSYHTVASMLSTDVVCVVRGRVSRRDDQVSIYAQELSLPDVSEGPRGPGVHPGMTEVHVRLTQPGRTVLMRLDDSLRVTASPDLYGDLKALLGPSCLLSS